MSTTSAGIERNRLRRALFLKVDRIGSGWMVHGHLVDEDHGCSCPDRRIRGGICKHEIAVRLNVLDAEILAALRALVAD